ncbi:hypothetical protein ZHAS_00010982 [Anopheles sinensis]|uniref:Uncharacterized protein n=1 Tax=Anopheles sinensis TaxID=74873 RepID=A0A084VZ10_ANOSI|nr:hypothetical protein ZHAS_00010982 [Anopheles sinensis]
MARDAAATAHLHDTFHFQFTVQQTEAWGARGKMACENTFPPGGDGNKCVKFVNFNSSPIGSVRLLRRWCALPVEPSTKVTYRSSANPKRRGTYGFRFCRSKSGRKIGKNNLLHTLSSQAEAEDNPGKVIHAEVMNRQKRTFVESGWRPDRGLCVCVSLCHYSTPDELSSWSSGGLGLASGVRKPAHMSGTGASE